MAIFLEMKLLGIILALLTVSLPLNEALCNPDPATISCGGKYCLFVRHDESLKEEALFLVETLRLRLCKHGVRIPSPEPSGVPPGSSFMEPNDNKSQDPPQDPIATEEHEGVESGDGCPNEPIDPYDPHPTYWVIHLNDVSPGQILLAVDYMEAGSGEDLIRELIKAPEPGATAWTLALAIEEAVLPYLESTRPRAPLGAGLAIIEPPEVGGINKKDLDDSRRLPKLRYVAAGLDIAYLGVGSEQLDSFIVGPRITVQGLLGPRFVASFGAGWLGTGEFKTDVPGDATTIVGRVSHVPLDLLFGLALADTTRFSATLMSGVSAGFSIYRFSSSSTNKSRTYLYFDPCIQIRGEVTVHVYGPLAIYLNAGAAIPIMRDIIEDLNTTVYSQDWMIPLFGIGLQLWKIDII